MDGELGEAVARAFRSGKSGTVEADGRSLFLNVHVPPPRIVAIGAVHISQALAPIARIAGFDIEIIDPRTAFATPERFAGVDASCRMAGGRAEERARSTATRRWPRSRMIPRSTIFRLPRR